jgi:LytS/YehU family sensor histidine kinase
MLRRIYLRLPAPRFLIAKVMLLSLVAAGIHSGSVQGLINVMHWSDNNWSPWERMFFLSVILWVLYLAWSLGYFWIKAEVQARREKRLAAEARAHAEKVEIQLLRAQLDPHFLFNTLNAVVSEINPHPAAAIEMLTELSSFLRYSLNHRHQQLTSLEVEIEAIQSYLKIQIARFGENLDASISATPQARKIPVPSFLLQPLVENAFKHGFEVTPAPWRLAITAELVGRDLTIMVRNSGKLLDSRKDGVGLDTIRRRLEIHYPGRHAFDIQKIDGHVLAILHLEGEPCFV